MTPYAMWTDDCQGKKDFDGPIISISTRYWPGPEGGGSMLVRTNPLEISTLPYGPKPSAHAAIHLRLGPAEEGDGGGDYCIWREKKFEGDTEAEVKAMVELWGQEQMAEIVDLMGGMQAFRNP
jgi:hypothetical protein